MALLPVKNLKSSAPVPQPPDSEPEFSVAFLSQIRAFFSATMHYGSPFAGYAVAVVAAVASGMAIKVLAIPPVYRSGPFLFFYPAIAITAFLGGVGPGLAAIGVAAVFRLLAGPTMPQIVNWVALFVLGPLFAIGFSRVRQLALTGQAAAREAARFKYVGDQATDTILLIDETGRILYANLMAGQHFGYPVERLNGQMLVSLVPEAQREDLRGALAETIGGPPRTVNITLPKPGTGQGPQGQVQLEMVCTGVRTDGPFVIHVAGRNVTDRLRLENRLNEIRHWESLGILAGGVSRDFHRLLALIQRNTVRVKDSLPPGDINEALLNEVTEATERSADLIQLIIATAGYRSPNIELLHPGLILDRVLSLRPLPLDVRVSVDAEPEVFPGDRQTLETLFWSLISNAAQSYKGHSGEVNVTVRTDRMRPFVVGSSTHKLRFEEGTAVGDCLALTVEDRGCGMPSEVLSRAFEPFYSTRAEGRGLGLPAVRGIVRAYSGALRLTTLAGEGTRVEIWLPRTNKTAVFD